MAGCTGSFGSVRIDPADALVGPARKNGKFHFSLNCLPGFRALYFNDRPMTKQTRISIRVSIRRFRQRFHIFECLNTVRGVRKGPENRVVLKISVRLRHEAFFVLFHLGGMTRGAVSGSHDSMNIISVVLEGILVLLSLDHMAFGTTDGGMGKRFRWFYKRNLPFQLVLF